MTVSRLSFVHFVHSVQPAAASLQASPWHEVRS